MPIMYIEGKDLHKAELHSVNSFFAFFCLGVLNNLPKRFVQGWIEKCQIVELNFTPKNVFQYMSLQEQWKQFVLE